MSSVLLANFLIMTGEAQADSCMIEGSWIYSSGPSNFEEMLLTDHGEFMSWLDARPFYSGVYTFSSDTLVIKVESDLTFRWLVLTVNSDSLEIRRAGEEENSVFVRSR